jgi:hypothetical protein
MLRAAILLTSACLLLSACRDESASSSATKTPDATSGTATPSDSAPPVAKVWTETETFGVASCDQFATAIKQCFATTKMPASAAAGIRGGFEQEFERWRIMKADPDLQDMLKNTCDRHLKGIADIKMGLDCR